jgi:predicted metal-binding membrane protein
MSDSRIFVPLHFPRISTGIMISTVGLAAASWALSIAQMSGMNMGTATELGSFGHFLPIWVTMMAAMMLPGVVAPLARQVSTDADVRAAPSFLLGYLAMWAVKGVVAYAVYRPHGTATAGWVVLAAGLYELMPLKRRCRHQCQTHARSGLTFGIACLGSSIGLMAVLLAISPMSIPWMAAITAVVVAQKLIRATWIIDALTALAIVGLGAWILAAPASVPGLMPTM